jgi:hypothetical protein
VTLPGRRSLLLALVAAAGGCALIELPIRLLVFVIAQVFRLGTTVVNAGANVLGSAAQSLGPYLLFWAAADPAAAPAPRDVELAALRASEKPDPVCAGFAEAIEEAPSGAGTALLVPAGTALEAGAAERIAARLRGTRLLGVSFAWRPGDPPTSATVRFLAPEEVAADLLRAGFEVVPVPGL